MRSLGQGRGIEDGGGGRQYGVGPKTVRINVGSLEFFK